MSVSESQEFSGVRAGWQLRRSAWAVAEATSSLDSTVVTDRSHKQLDRKELKPGLKVVVIALGHDMFDLEAFEVQLVDR